MRKAMSKRDELFNALKEKKLISLYYDRIMFYDEGHGEIQFWTLDEDEEADCLILENKGAAIYFDTWELSDKSLYISRGGKIIGAFKFPNQNKIIANHNHFYVEEFATTMSEILDAYTPSKGDWTYCDYQQVVDLLKKNVENLDDKEKIQRSCIDIANFAMMAYYLNEGRKQHE